MLFLLSNRPATVGSYNPIKWQLKEINFSVFAFSGTSGSLKTIPIVLKCKDPPKTKNTKTTMANLDRTKVQQISKNRLKSNETGYAKPKNGSTQPEAG